MGVGRKWVGGELGWGFHVDAPRKVTHDLQEFNLKHSTPEKRRALRMAMWDLQEFFPNVDRGLLRFAIGQAIQELKGRNPKWRYF